MRLVTLIVLASLAITLAPAALGPVGTASANCEIDYPDGGCTNACFIVGGIIHKVDPKAPIDCTE